MSVDRWFCSVGQTRLLCRVPPFCSCAESPSPRRPEKVQLHTSERAEYYSRSLGEEGCRAARAGPVGFFDCFFDFLLGSLARAAGCSDL